MLTRAVVLREPQSRLTVETLELDEPKAGEVRVRIRAAGVCHSDWHLVTGDTRHPLPAVLGHEGAGIVDTVGPGVTSLSPGDPVILNWAPACGACFYCERAQPNLCSTYSGPIWAGTLLDGTTRLSLAGFPCYQYCGLGCFADYAVVSERSCVRAPEHLPFEVAAVIGCAVTTGVGSVLNRARVEPGSSVAVFGLGGVGLSTVMAAKLVGANPIFAVDPIESRFLAAGEFGATHVLDPSVNVVETIKGSTQGRGVDYAFEAVGLPEVQETCLSATRPGGTIVLTGLAPMGSSTNLPGAVLVREEKTVKGCYYGSGNPSLDFVRYAELYRRGDLPLDRLVRVTYPLERVNEAFEDMMSGEVRRGVLIMDE